MRHVRLVAGRELHEMFRSRSYWITMGILVAAVTAMVVLPRILAEDPRFELGLAGPAPDGIEADLRTLAEAAEAELEVRVLPDSAAARQAVEAEEIDAALAFRRGEGELIRRAATSQRLLALASQAAAGATARERLVEAGLEPGAAETALATPPPEEVVVDDEQPGRRAVASLVSLVLYLALFIGGMSVATGVAVEKSSHIAEVLLPVLRPAHLLAGKVFGIAVSTLLLLGAGALPFGVGLGLGVVDVPPVAVLDVFAAFGWFLLGYAIYATGFGALGALIDRQEDLGGAVGPFTAALVLSYLAAIQAQNAPTSALAMFTSLFPFSSPLVMPMRIAEGAATPVEIATAVGLGVVTAMILVRLGGTIYRRALLRGGRRLTVTEALRG